MKFRTEVEPPEPMRGLAVPPEVVEALGGGKRPRIRVTLNGHTWSTRIAIMRGRNLIGLSNANRTAAGVSVGERVEVRMELDTEPLTVTEPEDFTAALAADPVARAAYERSTVSQRRQFVRMIEAAKQERTRMRRIEKVLTELREKG
ncbi:YdeI/OmpD-associated family protein [Nocardia sp. NPDC052254]|uniref:YdeI/OmpD-associated family protein n=1 Tax=Nocardia sp. NPDC052254 TaxID=3155681 RepID=UPI003449D697